MLLLLVVVALGCGGAFAELMSKGDSYASAGMWDEAAAAYREALKLEPDNTDAAIKLKQAQQQQSAQRLSRAVALEQRGELKAALELVQEAVKLDPTSSDAQKALARINEAALSKAEKLLADDRGREAFELSSLVLKGSPNDPRAQQLDDKIRRHLAQQAFDRATAYLEQKKHGNALVELAACLSYRPDFPDAKLHFGRVKLELEQQLRYYVVLGRFVGQGKNNGMSQALKPDLLQQSLDDRLLLEVVDKKPASDADTTRFGIALAGSFDGYDFKHDQRSTSRSCDYVCGTESKPNPERAQVEQAVAAAEQRQARADEEVARAEQEMLRHQQDADRIRADVDRQQQEVDKARSDLDRCQQSAKPGDSSACSSERSRLQSAQSRLESERRRLSNSPMETARSRLESARSSRDSARRDVEQATARMRSTPTMITVDKYCPFSYKVDIHNVSSKVVLKLTIDRLDEGTSILRDQPFDYTAADEDDTFDPHPGRCGEVASGNPLQLADEKALRQELMKQVVRDIRSKIMASYDAYRQRFLGEARRQEAAGLSEEAVEAYVRYVLTGPHQLKDKDQISAFFAKAKGLGQLNALWSM